ncbi:hypothetical protein [Streptomyces sp. NPDC059398]|uniref:hypothetical protein n=1 Tax=Streptomyces sp. NPDC059398 TaxID=3346820 RepID=UPI0036C3C1FB
MHAGKALAVYDRHGDALFSLALLLCRDLDRAVEAVVATVTQVPASASDVTPEAERHRLAADLWHRCAGASAGSGEGPVLPSQANTPAESDGSSSEQEHALLGLVLFGSHTYGQAAALIGVAPPSAALRLRSVLRLGSASSRQHSR